MGEEFLPMNAIFKLVIKEAAKVDTTINTNLKK